MALLSGALALALVAAPASAPTPGVFCELRPDRTLEIVAEGYGLPPTLRRTVDRIAVTDDVGLEYPCQGGRPTVENVDAISFVSHAAIRGLTVDLGDGPLAPGATDEGDGSSEIEAEAQLGPRGVLEVHMGKGRDRVTMGSVNGSAGALNLDSSEQRDDPDLVFRGSKPQVLVDLGHGRDLLSWATTDGFDGPYRMLAFADGGPEGDLLLGGPGPNGLIGGNGRDVMHGGPGPDRLFGDEYGHPHHRLLRTPDRLVCGRGSDTARVDRSDRTRGCEHVHVRTPH